MALHVQGQREDPAETSPEDPAVLDAEANLQPWEHYIVKHCSGFQYRKCLKTAQEATDLREQDCVVAGLNRKKCDAPPAYNPDVSAALGGPRVAHRAVATPVRSGATVAHETCGKAHVPPSSTTNAVDTTSEEKIKHEIEVGQLHLLQLDLIDEQIALELQEQEKDLAELEMQMQLLHDLDAEEQALEEEAKLLKEISEAEKELEHLRMCEAEGQHQGQCPAMSTETKAADTGAEINTVPPCTFG